MSSNASISWTNFQDSQNKLQEAEETQIQPSNSIQGNGSSFAQDVQIVSMTPQQQQLSTPKYQKGTPATSSLDDDFNFEENSVRLDLKKLAKYSGQKKSAQKQIPQVPVSHDSPHRVLKQLSKESPQQPGQLPRVPPAETYAALNSSIFSIKDLLNTEKTGGVSAAEVPKENIMDLNNKTEGMLVEIEKITRQTRVLQQECEKYSKEQQLKQAELHDSKNELEMMKVNVDKLKATLNAQRKKMNANTAASSNWQSTLSLFLVIFFIVEIAVFLATYSKFKTYLGNLEAVISYNVEYWQLLKQELSRYQADWWKTSADLHGDEIFQ